MTSEAVLATRLPSTLCSRCERELDAATRVRGAERPRPGDVSMCLYCGALHTFTKRLKLRRMSFAEIDALGPETRAFLRRMQRARRELSPS